MATSSALDLINNDISLRYISDFPFDRIHTQEERESWRKPTFPKPRQYIFKATSGVTKTLILEARSNHEAENGHEFPPGRTRVCVWGWGVKKGGVALSRIVRERNLSRKNA